MSEDLALKTRLLNASLPHVVFDGWGDEPLNFAAQECGVAVEVARALFPRGGIDLAMAYHRAGDAEMLARFEVEPLEDMRFRDKIAALVKLRLKLIEDKELVRRGSSLFSLPQNSADGAKLIWGTCDAIWNALGDTSEDANWYTKRATLSGVYGATVLYWLGDDSEGHVETWAFLDRRIDNVMQFEKVKAAVAKTPVLGRLISEMVGRIQPPNTSPRDDVPGTWTDKTKEA
ncbi:COQ9 family protein [Cochlodiniinecator piscidefendens]|uniref:COQ9 family protein n=1 Tax=Cochlodiniinecator piscidefendens TaxID=2715756 RepID=UPI001408C01B|nr:COQ9 family protein [Cochlodiniinecator piscidefendens]